MKIEEITRQVSISNKLESEDNPRIATIINELDEFFSSYSSNLRVKIEKNVFTVNFPDYNFPDCKIMEFTPRISQEEFQRNKASYRSREEYERYFFNAGGGRPISASAVMEGIFVVVNTKTKNPKKPNFGLVKAMRISSGKDILNALILFQEEEYKEEYNRLNILYKVPIEKMQSLIVGKTTEVR